MRSFTRAYREHGYTMKKIADHLGVLERGEHELAVGVASKKNRVCCRLPVIDVLCNSPAAVHEQELRRALCCS